MEPSNPAPPLPKASEPAYVIDWLSFAPWTLLFRVPAAVFGWPLVAGAVGVLLFGGVASDGTSIAGDPVAAIATASQAVWSFPRDALVSVGETFTESDRSMGWRLVRLGVATLGAAVWGWLAVFIADRASIRLTDSDSQSFVSSLRRATHCLPRVLVFVVLAMGFLWLATACWPWLTHALLVEAWEPIGWLAAVGWGGALVISLLLVASLAVVVVSSMLFPAALAVERCDAFDATSRVIAYTTQRVGRLVSYAALAAVLGIATGAAVELVFDAAMTLTYSAFPTLDRLGEAEETTALSIASTWTALLTRMVDGFYPAYFFTAATAIYLLLRRDIDGQSIDEVVGDADQDSSSE